MNQNTENKILDGIDSLLVRLPAMIQIIASALAVYAFGRFMGHRAAMEAEKRLRTFLTGDKDAVTVYLTPQQFSAFDHWDFDGYDTTTGEKLENKQ